MSEARMKENNGEHPFGDAAQLIFFFTFLIVWAADSFFLKWSVFLSASLPLVLRLVVSALVWAAGVWIVKSGHVVASGDERPDEVIRAGVFRHVRHPLYLGSLLLYVGLTISTASLLSLAMFVVVLFFYDFIAGYEEKLLEAKFGESYRDYRSVTGKWLPRLRAGVASQAGAKE